MVDKRNRILQTEKHQDTGGDMSVKCGFWRKNTFFRKKLNLCKKYVDR